jgi:serine/threonine-protein kinase PknG
LWAAAVPVPESGSSRRRVSSAQTRLGAGLVELAPVARRDPVSAVQHDPRVPEHRRVCRTCRKPVGRSRDGRPGRDRGFCPVDGTPFSFVPALAEGDLVEGRYEIRGCLAYGGFGWIYLARDGKLGDTHAERWVVLKGLIDVNDPDAVASAVNERRFLVEVDHPGIVKIYDFARHPDPHTGTIVGYLVMEYLGGRSLQDIHTTQPGPLPLTTVLTYGLEILAALGYLHDNGLLYCDLKPDNVIHVGDALKLIDLGAVLRMSDREGAVFGTAGYQAPELERPDAPADPTVASDIYTVGRTLAALSLPIEGFGTRHRHSLPDPAEAPLLADEESYHRLLLRATHPDPPRRFGSAEEMREQLHGVLAEVVASTKDDARLRAPMSARFTPERRAFGTGAGAVSVNGHTEIPVDWTTVPQCLPTPLADPADPSASLLAALSAAEPDELVGTLLAAPVRSEAVQLRLIDARAAAGDVPGARAELAALSIKDWRVDWYSGVVALAGGEPDRARQAFQAVYDALPGELAPKLALAAAAEWGGDDARAGSLYERVWRTDIGHVSAAFGLARVLRRADRRKDAVATLEAVPESSSQYVLARVAAIRARLDPGRVTRSDLNNATKRLRDLKMDIERQARLTVEVLTAKLNWTLSGLEGPDGPDQEFDEVRLRRELERAYRNLAKLAEDPEVRSGMVDRANRIRPKTLF